MESPKEKVPRRSVIQVLALAVMAQGFLSIPPALTQAAVAAPPHDSQPPAGDSAAIIGVL